MHMESLVWMPGPKLRLRLRLKPKAKSMLAPMHMLPLMWMQLSEQRQRLMP